MNARIYLFVAIGVLTVVGAVTYELPHEGAPVVAPPPIVADISSASAESQPAPSPTPSATPRCLKAPGPAPEGMVWIPGGTAVLGDDEGKPDEQPAHSATIDGFWMDATEVTNGAFKKFTDATGYLTIAERTPKREDFNGQVADINAIPAENLVAGSICFNPKFDRRALAKDQPLWPLQVWQYVKGANWRHPDGPTSSVDDKLQHPVVHVSWDDAVAYCEWAHKRLPTEAEWEYAARGGQKAAIYPCGNELVHDGKWLANIWQGEFPETHEVKDGFRTTAPVASFPPNGYGLFDMAGNVWEWCNDFYRPDYYRFAPLANPRGPSDSFDPLEPDSPKRVQRGGSFMCSDNYCRGYRITARMKQAPDSGTFHAGFRCVRSPEVAETTPNKQSP
ncbi:MAG TPA: formylglycine-generating enzyme family protein [Planctomycetaceae bacterium]|nr:formylglycine-generating enzyme family protein [Planctomycetaceae bacterium]